MTAMVRSLTGVLGKPEMLTAITSMLGETESTDGSAPILPKLIARYLGTSDRTARSAVRLSLVALVGGLADRAHRPIWASALYTLLDRHDPALLDNPSHLVPTSDDPEASETVDMILGHRRLLVEIEIADETGLSETTVSRLLELLVPISLSFLARKKRGEGMDRNAMVTYLTAQESAQQAGQPAVARTWVAGRDPN